MNRSDSRPTGIILDEQFQHFEQNEIGNHGSLSPEVFSLPPPTNTYEAIFERLLELLKDQKLVQPIMLFIESYIGGLNDIPDNFVAWIVHGFVGQSLSWPVVKWTEGGKEALAIFKVVPGNPICSTLIHYGVKSEQSGVPMWSEPSLYWMVWDLEDIRDLLGAANQALSVMDLSPEKLELFVDRNRKECSDQE
jgi:hypothetical protein